MAKFGSSANLHILLTIFASRLFISIRNSSGPNALPCGAPDVHGGFSGQKICAEYFHISGLEFVHSGQHLH